MAMKESNKDRAKRLAKEAETAKRLEALDKMAEDSQKLGLYEDYKPKSGVEGWVSQDAFPHAKLTTMQFKWIAIGVAVALVALLIV